MHLSLTQLRDGSNLEFAEFDFGAFRLQGDAAFTGSSICAVVDEGSVDPDFDSVIQGFNDHGVPFADRFFGAVREVLDTAEFVARGTPVLLRATPFFHVGNGDIFSDTPEIACIAALHLNFDGGREHPIEGAWSGGMNKDAAISGFSGEAVLDFEAVVFVEVVGDEVSAGVAEADEEAVTDDKRGRSVFVIVHRGNVHVPAIQVLAVEEAGGAFEGGGGEVLRGFFLNRLVPGRCGGVDEGEGRDGADNGLNRVLDSHDSTSNVMIYRRVAVRGFSLVYQKGSNMRHAKPDTAVRGGSGSRVRRNQIPH